MLFPFGWPQTYRLPREERIIALRLSPAKRKREEYLAVLTERGLYVFSSGRVRPHGAYAFVERALQPQCTSGSFGDVF